MRTDPDDDEYFAELKDTKGKLMFRNKSEAYRFCAKYVRMFGSAEAKERDAPT